MATHPSQRDSQCRYLPVRQSKTASGVLVGRIAKPDADQDDAEPGQQRKIVNIDVIGRLQAQPDEPWAGHCDLLHNFAGYDDIDRQRLILDGDRR